MSDLHERFEKLARRGTVRGADDVLAAARRHAEDSGAIAGVDGAASVADDDRTPPPSVAVEPVSLELAPNRRRRRAGPMVAAGGVAATLFVGVLAIGSFVGSGGGSDSPEGAVRQLAAAVSHADPLAAADVLAPEEVRSLRGTVDAATKRAQELTLVQNASAPLSGVDLSVDDLNLSTQSLADGYAKVIVNAGTISARTDKAQFSPLMQHVLRNSDEKSASTDLSRLARRDGLPTFVVTVQRGGHWYVSAAYTTLEYIREVNHLPAADFGSGVRATATLGADTPDAAVTDALQALSHGDWAKLISLAPPDEIPVYDYRAALEQLAADSHPSFTVDKVDTTSTVSGATAKVKLVASGATDSGDKWSVDGSCFTGIQDYSVTGSASGIGGSSQQTATRSAGPPSTTCGLGGLYLFPIGSAASGSSDAITTVQEDGRWFVSPVGTVLDLLDHEIASITQRDLDTLLNVPELLPPDGTLTLGQPVALTRSVSVYTFAGHRGEQLLALATTKSQHPADGFSAEVRVFGPDGKELETAGGMLEGLALQLPVDGAYKVIFRPFFADVTVTVWDQAQAPAAAKNPTFTSGTSGTGQCTFTAAGETCSSSSTSVPAG
jgi:hypothetical protein